MRDLFVLSILFVGVFGALGMLSTWLKLVIDLKCYKKVEGIIIKSETKYKYVASSKPIKVLSPKHVDICYIYNVGEKKYESKKITYKEFFFQDINFLEKYPLNKKVSVFYDPANPKKSVLQLDSNFETYLIFVLIFSGFIYVGMQYLLFPGKYGV